MKKSFSHYPKKIISTLKNEGVSALYKLTYSFILSRYRRKFTRNERLFDNWKNLKNIYDGKRAFLIGNGPSLNKTPLFFLKDEKTIVFNRFNLMFERLNWRPTFYTTVDERVAENNFDEINSINQQVLYSFFPDIHPRGTDFRKFIKNRENIYWLKLQGRGYSVALPHCGLNGTVANVGLQLLIYMGFKEIYLLGVDMNYLNQKSVVKEDKRDWTATKDDDPNHFDPRYFGKGKKYHKPRIDDLVLPGYIEAKKFADSQNVKIYNATYGGELEVFPRIKFDTLFNFSNQQQFELLFDEKYNYTNESLVDSFENSIIIDDNNFNENQLINNSKHILVMNQRTGEKVINKLIFNYIPKGPIFNKYVFIPRNLGDSSDKVLK